MSVEDRVRTATRVRAGLVRDIRPLDLPAAKPLRLPRAPRARGWSTWMAPVTAAAVVVALAITTVALREVWNEPSVSPATSTGSGTGVTSAAAVPPKYYAALYDPLGAGFSDQKDTHAVDLAWGPSIGTTQPMIAPPPGQTFAGVTAAANGRTFVVSAESFVQAYNRGTPGKKNEIIDGTSETTGNAPGWTDEMTFGVVSQGKFTRLHVSMQAGAYGPGSLVF